MPPPQRRRPRSRHPRSHPCSRPRVPARPPRSPPLPPARRPRRPAIAVLDRTDPAPAVNHPRHRRLPRRRPPAPRPPRTTPDQRSMQLRSIPGACRRQRLGRVERSVAQSRPAPCARTGPSAIAALPCGTEPEPRPAPPRARAPIAVRAVSTRRIALIRRAEIETGPWIRCSDRMHRRARVCAPKRTCLCASGDGRTTVTVSWQIVAATPTTERHVASRRTAARCSILRRQRTLVATARAG
jgi:hypothetical protein